VSYDGICLWCIDSLIVKGERVVRNQDIALLVLTVLPYYLLKDTKEKYEEADYVSTSHVVCIWISSSVSEIQKNARRSHVMQPDAVAVERQRSSQIWHRLCPCPRALYLIWIRHLSCDWLFPTSKFAVSWICVSTDFTQSEETHDR